MNTNSSPAQSNVMKECDILCSLLPPFSIVGDAGENFDAPFHQTVCIT